MEEDPHPLSLFLVMPLVSYDCLLPFQIFIADGTLLTFMNGISSQFTFSVFYYAKCMEVVTQRNSLNGLFLLLFFFSLYCSEKNNGNMIWIHFNFGALTKWDTIKPYHNEPHIFKLNEHMLCLCRGRIHEILIKAQMKLILHTYM